MGFYYFMLDLPKLFSDYDNHELVMYAHDEAAGLKCFIAIHNTTLGPATGGTRYAFYKSDLDAISDVLRLSKAMTYKCALAGVPYGGGKAVIVADRTHKNREKLFRAYAQKINTLNGRFTTGEDVGVTEKDLRVMQKNSPFINGKPNLAGDLSPWAALGVFVSMKAALKEAFGSDSLSSRTIAIKGLGKVGSHLLELISEEGGKIYGADIEEKQIKEIKKKFPKVRIVSPKEIHKMKVDVFSPCALGADVNPTSLKEFKCRIICGGANNQLLTKDLGAKLHKQGILYIPDYVANAGGLINVAGEMNPHGYSRDWVEKKVKGIGKTVRIILEKSRKDNKSTVEVSDKLAENILAAKAKKKNK